MYELFIALRYLKSKKKLFVSVITLICVFGVMLGVGTLTSVVSITGGFEEAFRQKVLGINSHILVMKYGVNFREYRDTLEMVEGVPGVTAASPFIFHEMMVHHDERTSWVLIKGIDTERTDRVSDLPQYIREGAISDLRWDKDRAAPGVHPGILLGGELAQKLKVQKGDTLELVSPLRGLGEDSWAPTQMAPTSHVFTVAGIYNSGFYEYDNKLVMVDYKALQDFFDRGDVVSGLELRVEDVFATGDISRQIKAQLPPGRFRTLDWREINRNLFTSLKLQKLALALILTFIVIVASFNIVSTLIMLVLDKSKEIAILKSMGASDGSVMRIFIIQGMIIGGAGTALGLAAGWIACTLLSQVKFGMDPKVYLIDSLPVKMQLWEFGAVAAVSLLISFLATLYPSWRAARLSPVEGLRYE
jgi:lipoprotein-releasing system permease protein